MSFSVWIIEASGKTKTFKEALSKIGRGRDRVLATYGRVMDISDDIVAITNDMLKDASLISWKELRPGQSEKIKQMCHGSVEIFIATDSDLEGELIAKHLFDSLGSIDIPLSRVSLSGITSDHMKLALNNRQPLNTEKIIAATSRRIFDRHIGYQLNSSEDHFPMSMGRIISPLIKSLDEKPPITTIIECELNRGWKAIFRLPSYLSAQAETLCGVLSALPVITPITVSKERIFIDKKPLIGSDAIVLCSNKTSLSVEKIIDVLQDNYMSGSLSYPRTDSRRLGEIGVKWARIMAEKSGKPFSDKILSEKSVISEQDSQDAHEAIIPLSDRMCNISPHSERLTDSDKVLCAITEHCATMGSAPEEMMVEVGGFSSDNDSLRWRSTVKAYSRHMTLERASNTDGITVKDAYAEITRKPDATEPRVRLWRDSPQLAAAKRLIELGLGRPSTIGINSGKAAKNYLNESAEVNGRGKLMIHRVSQRCPMLLEAGVAKKIERTLVGISSSKSIEDRIKSAWMVIDDSPDLLETGAGSDADKESIDSSNAVESVLDL